LVVVNEPFDLFAGGKFDGLRNGCGEIDIALFAFSIF